MIRIAYQIGNDKKEDWILLYFVIYVSEFVFSNIYFNISEFNNDLHN
jgi:hypothetical protein